VDEQERERTPRPPSTPPPTALLQAARQHIAPVDVAPPSPRTPPQPPRARDLSLSEEIVFQPPDSAGAYAAEVAEADEFMEPKDEEEDDASGDDAGVDEGPFDVELVDEPAPWAGKGRGRGSSSSSGSLGGRVRRAEDGSDPLACMMFHCKLFCLCAGLFESRTFGLAA
jgi:hypothetical protein